MTIAINRGFLRTADTNLNDEEYKLRDLCRLVWEFSYGGSATLELLDAKRQVLNGQWREGAPEGETEEAKKAREAKLSKRVAKEMQRFAVVTVAGRSYRKDPRDRQSPWIHAERKLERIFNEWQRRRVQKNSAVRTIFEAIALSGVREADDSGWLSEPLHCAWEVRVLRDGTLENRGNVFGAAQRVVFYFASRNNDVVRGRLSKVIASLTRVRVAVPVDMVKRLVKDGVIEDRWLTADTETTTSGRKIVRVQLITKEQIASCKAQGAKSLKAFRSQGRGRQQRQFEN